MSSCRIPFGTRSSRSPHCPGSLDSAFSRRRGQRQSPTSGSVVSRQRKNDAREHHHHQRAGRSGLLGTGGQDERDQREKHGRHVHAESCRLNRSALPQIGSGRVTRPEHPVPRSPGRELGQTRDHGHRSDRRRYSAPPCQGRTRIDPFESVQPEPAQPGHREKHTAPRLSKPDPLPPLRCRARTGDLLDNNV